MLAVLKQQSLFKRVPFLITVAFFSLVIANTTVLIWSYSVPTWQHVKLIIFFQTDSFHLYQQSPSYKFEINEFSFSFNELFTNYWNAPALFPALAIVISTYIYPYVKILVYIIVFFVPLKHEYQTLATFQINQFNKIMFIPFVAILIQCATFSMTIVPPTHTLQNLIDINGEAYPGTGLIINMFNILVYAITDYLLFIIIKSPHKPIVPMEIQTQTQTQTQTQYMYTPTSYLAMLWRSIFMVIIIGNIWLFLEALTTVPVRFQLDGVLAKFVPDKYITNNIFETGHILLATSLLNDTTAWFLYLMYITVFVAFPCIVSALLFVIWILYVPLFNTPYGCTFPKYGLNILWFLFSWASCDVFLLCQFGASQQNIKNGTKYIFATKFPHYCGESGLVTKIFGEDCSWTNARFEYGLTLYILSVVVQFVAIIYTNKVLTIDQTNINAVKLKRTDINT